GFELRYVGPILDAGEGAALLCALAGRPWARYLGEVPHAAMPAALHDADIVLNCSLSEGGMANSVLEALAFGRAVLASDIEGNRPYDGSIRQPPSHSDGKGVSHAAVSDAASVAGTAGPGVRRRIPDPPGRDSQGHRRARRRRRPCAHRTLRGRARAPGRRAGA